MPRKFSGKSHVGVRREKRKNGDIYIYERITAYNQKTQKTYTVSESLKGKIKAGTQELVATRPKKKNNDVKTSTVNASRTHTGLTDILNWIGTSSKIDSDIYRSFSSGDAAKILSIAQYWVGTGGNTLPRLESWQIMHSLPYSEGISENVYSELFKSIGTNENSVQQYFSHRAEVLDTQPVLAFDSTTVSTYSENQIETRRGFNKDKDGLNTIKLLTLYSVKDHEPIAFSKQPGNLPDVTSIENTIKQIKCFPIDKPLIVTDNGYYSQKNIMEFAHSNMKFMTLADPDISWIRDEIDSLREPLEKLSSACPFDINISGASTTRMQKFERIRQRAHNGKSKGDKEIFSRRLYVHVFYSPNNTNKYDAAFRKKKFELKAQIEEGETEFTEQAKKRIKKYLICSRVGRGGKMKVSFNEPAYIKAKKYYGYFALVSNQSIDTFEALKNYRLREKIEEFFADQKGSFDGRKPRTWYPDSLRGRQFVQFVGLGYMCFITKRIKELQETLGVEEDGKTKYQINLEKKLKTWLEQHSLTQIFDWFDCIETTTVKTDATARRWSTETTTRDRLFLQLLGVIKE